MAVAGHRQREAAPDKFSDDELTAAEEDAENLLETFLVRQFASAKRLDRAAEVLTTFAWVMLGIGLAAGFAAGLIIVANGDTAVGLATMVGVSAASAFLFLPLYFTPVWARAFAAKSMAEVHRSWVRLL
jgi:ABC-type multidrug transport system fused ATPase/permease subunit